MPPDGMDGRPCGIDGSDGIPPDGMDGSPRGIDGSDGMDGSDGIPNRATVTGVVLNGGM